jgi:hypothetical protein
MRGSKAVLGGIYVKITSLCPPRLDTSDIRLTNIEKVTKPTYKVTESQ